MRLSLCFLALFSSSAFALRGTKNLDGRSRLDIQGRVEQQPLLATAADTEAYVASGRADEGTLEGKKEGGNGDYTPEAEADRIVQLPGAPKVDFGMFGGYVTVSADAGRALYYVFTEAEEDAASKPVVLWMNGGPGCSSLGGGFLAELGPFFPRPDAQTLYKNIYAFNKAANIIFLDSPAFTGFSYSNSTEDADVGDVRTAQDARAFLSGFFERFPQYRENELYLAGESYAGHYVPNLAKELVEWNVLTSGSARTFNLKGFFLGNPWTDPIIDSTQTVVNLWHRGFLSDDTALGVLALCNFTHIPFPDYELQVRIAAKPLLSAVGPESEAAARFEEAIARRKRREDEEEEAATPAFDDDECNRLIAHADVELGPINIYDLYVDVCNQKAHMQSYFWSSRLADKGSPLGALLANTGRRAQSAAAPLTAAGLGQQAQFASSVGGWWPHGKDKKQDDKTPPVYDPCVGVEVADYLNRPEVQRAIHANTTGLEYPWTECSDIVNYSDDDLMTSMLPVYTWLFKNAPELRIMVYSGDVDGIVPILGTRTWLRELDMEMVEDLKPWYIVDPNSPSPQGPSFGMQVAGYIIKYKELTFASVRNAGHMVPLTQPARALTLFEAFLRGDTNVEK